MALQKNITVFPNLFIEERVKKLYDSFEYFNEKVANEDPGVAYENLYSFKLIPEYFKLNHRSSTYTIKKIPQYNWGYSILLNNVNAVEDYLQQQFNSKKRSIVKRYVNRLEACFNIRYELYYGDLSPEKYRVIMGALKNMIVERFKVLNDTHKNIKEWDFLLSSTYEKIINKTASLFVIYHDTEPIEISLNYHYDKILFSYVSSYSIDYSKFGLGHIEIFKQLEWCIKNGYILFEMGVGGTDYKRRWSNNIYRYYHYIIYSNKALLAGTYNTLKFKVKEYLKSKKPEKNHQKLSKTVKKRVTTPNDNIMTNNIININNNMNTKISNLTEVNYNNKTYAVLRKHVFNFLYTTVDHVKHIKVYKVNNNEFIIEGKNKQQTILLN